MVVSASIGIALSDGSGTPSDLLEKADAAMYRAKERGKARVEMYDESMRANTLRRLQVESALRTAIDREHLVVFFQAEVGLADGDITGAEALVRWRDPARGLVSPGEFIPVAEETGLIVPLGAWVLREACEEAARLRAAGRDLKVAVNLSTRQLAHPGLVRLVADTLEETGVNPASLCLEITETVLMQDADRAVVLLEELKSLGVTLSLDDFGTGYSSLSYLQRFPVDVVKVDQSFVGGLVDRARRREHRGRRARRDPLARPRRGRGGHRDARAARRACRRWATRRARATCSRAPVPPRACTSCCATAAPG